MKSFKQAVISSLAMSSANARGADSCTALVLSGGGSNGAWEAGAFWGLVNYGNPDDFRYDVLSGISAGAINSIALVGWKIGDELNAAQWLSDMWNTLHTTDVWVEWTLGIVSGLLIQPGIVDNSPLLRFLEATMYEFEKLERRISLGTVNVETGEFTVWDQKNTEMHDMPRAAVTSASIPGVFPPHVWPGRGIFMDGGTVYNVNMNSAIDQCLEVVDDESKITIDLFVCGPEPEPVEETGVAKTLSNIQRSRAIRGDAGSTNTILDAMRAHPNVNYRYLIYESDSTHRTGISELEFNGEKTWPMQAQGRQDAQDALNRGPGATFRTLLEKSDAILQ